MGAAGYIHIYTEPDVRMFYDKLWGDLGYTIESDWWYPSWEGDTVARININGVWCLIDYRDDQGNHDGTHNSFWFVTPSPSNIDAEWAEIDARVPEDQRPWWLDPRKRAMDVRDLFGILPSQARVLMALHRAGHKRVEVWT